MATAPPPFNQNYFVFHAGEVQGPYDLAFIEAMVLSGIYPPDVTLSKDGKIGWERLDVLAQPAQKKSPLPPGIQLDDPANAPPQPPRQPQSRPASGKKNYGCFLVLTLVVGISVITGIVKQSSAPIQPAYQSPATPAGDQSAYQPTYQTPAATQPVYQPAPAQTYSMTGENGQVYSVPDASYQILLPRKNQLDTWSTRLDESKTYVDALGKQVETDRATVDDTNQYSVENFNLEVKKYNDSSTQLQADIDAYNKAVDAFNADLARVGTPTR